MNAAAPPGVLVSLCLALGASAVEIDLTPRYQVGDTYALSLEHTTRTAALSRGNDGESTAELVRVRYGATVEIVTVDTAGHAARERHVDVHLTVERPDAGGSLFEPGTALDVRRDPDGEVRIYADGYRLPHRKEKIVEEVLATQFEHTVQPVLFAPGRSVEIGESWRIDAALARRFLRERGIRVIALDGTPTAALVQESDATDAPVLAIAYRIPIGRFELTDMPPNSSISRSDARFEGRIQLPDEPGQPPSAFTSHLTLSMDGVRTSANGDGATRPGLTRPLAWSVQSSKRSSQTLVMTTPPPSLTVSQRPSE